MEKIIAKTVAKHIEDIKVMGRTQHGFKKWKSCLTNLTEF